MFFQYRVLKSKMSQNIWTSFVSENFQNLAQSGHTVSFQYHHLSPLCQSLWKLPTHTFHLLFFDGLSLSLNAFYAHVVHR